MPQMKDAHRFFLQSFMSKGVLEPRDVRKLHHLACERFSEPYRVEGLVEFVNTINSNIKPVHLEIRKSIKEDTGAHCYGLNKCSSGEELDQSPDTDNAQWVLVNTRESEITRLASDYSVTELEFFKKMIEYVIESDTGTLSTIDSVNLAEKLPDKKLTKHEAQELLVRLTRDNWLCKNAEGDYYMSTRSILELEQYMFEQYPDSTVKCNMCKRICLQGQSCSICEVKLHKHCAARFFEKTEKTCPGATCGAPWPHEVPAVKSSRPANQEQSDSSSQQNAPPPQSQPERRKRRGGRE